MTQNLNENRQNTWEEMLVTVVSIEKTFTIFNKFPSFMVKCVHVYLGKLYRA